MAVGSVTPIRYDLAKAAIVTQVISATQFVAAGLAGEPNGSMVGYSVWVLAKADGTTTAPKGDAAVAISAFIGSGAATGIFGTVTHAAFTALLAVGDMVLLVPLSLLAAGFGAGRTVSNPVVANWQVAEQNLVLIGAAATRNKVHSLMIDMNAIAGTLTIRMYHAVNGIQRQIYSQAFTVAVDGPGRWTINGTVGIFDVLRVTCQSNNAADNGAAIGYSYLLEAM